MAVSKPKKWIAMVLIALGVILVLPYLLPVYHTTPNGVPPFPESRFDTLSGVIIHSRFHDAGPLSKGSVMLVHGFCGSVFSWRHTYDSLVSRNYSVLCPDLPPFGYSDRKGAENSSSSERAALLHALAEKCLPGKSWWMVGHSMGASCAAAFAATFPAQTSGLILVDGGLPQTTQKSVLWKHLVANELTCRYAEVASRLKFTQTASIEKLLASAYGRKPSAEEVRGYQLPLQLKGTASGIMNQVHAEEQLPFDKKHWQNKTHIIWGEKDKWIPAETANTVANTLQTGAPFIIPQAGHCPMETHPAAFTRALFSILKPGS